MISEYYFSDGGDKVIIRDIVVGKNDVVFVKLGKSVKVIFEEIYIMDIWGFVVDGIKCLGKSRVVKSFVVLG